MNDLKIEFTRHALRKLEHRKISKRQVIETVLRPEKIILDGSKFCAFKKFGRLYLKVIFVRLGSVAIILTQHLTGKLK